MQYEKFINFWEELLQLFIDNLLKLSALDEATKSCVPTTPAVVSAFLHQLDCSMT